MTEDPRLASATAVTDWSLILSASRDRGAARQTAWEEISRRYWPAIFAYVRRAGHAPEEASDLTQGFIAEVMIRRDLLGKADPARGRFRTLLRTALQNYLRQAHRDASRLKRRPEGGLRRLVSGDVALDARLAADATPDEAFDGQWRAVLVRAVVERERSRCELEGLGRHWQVFEARIVRPLIDGSEPVPYPALVERLGLESSAQAQNMMITIKRRFARLIRDTVAETVADPAEIRDELVALLRGGEEAP